MVLMAAASDHHTAAKSSSLATASPSPSTAPAATASSTRSRLHGFSFPTLSWGTHRLLRCSKNGASGSTSASPPKHPHTPSPEKEKPQDSAGDGAGDSQPQRPWNLRTRRSATAAPTASRSEGAGKESAASGGQALQPPAPPPAEVRKRGLSFALTKEEIVEDFIAIRGTRPPRRPKKRPRTVQRQFDMLYPGLSLADVNLDSYKIAER